MPTVTDLLLVVVLLVAAGAAWWLLGDLRGVPPGGAEPGRAGSVAVVVPARDEEATLPQLLASLRALATPVREIVVVDDGSRDDTAAVAVRGGATVVAAGAPPPGWTGKAWACDLGARSTGADLLLFLDADVELGPGAVEGLLAVHAEHGGLVSVQPFHRVVRAYEQLSAYFNVLSLMGGAAFARWPAGRPAGRPTAYGPCLLTSRGDYERVGGHAVVRGEIVDDVQLAAAYDRAGLPVRCLAGGASVRMRSYPGGLRQLADGWTKNVASGASTAARGPTLGAIWWVCAHHAIGVGLILAVVKASTGLAAPLMYGSLGLWAVAWPLFAVQLRAILRRTGSFSWWTWVLFPLPLLAFDLIFARSLALTVVRRSVRWRGREVAIGAAGRPGGGR